MLVQLVVVAVLALLLLPTIAAADTCTDLSQARAALAQAPNACYDFAYTRLIFSPTPPTPVLVQVRQNNDNDNNDMATDQRFHSLVDILDFVQEECCQTTSTTNSNNIACNIRYHNFTGMPEFVSIDYDPRIADEEVYYQIQDFHWVDCDTDLPILVVEPPVVETCVDAKAVAEEWTAGQALWHTTTAAATSSCYTFTIQRLGRINPAYAGPFQVHVVNETVAVTENGAWLQQDNKGVDKSIDDWFALVQQTCLAGCGLSDHDDGVSAASTPAFQCQLETDATYGYPVKISIDHSRLIADEEEYYELSNLTFAEDCAKVFQPEPPVSEELKCHDWEKVQTDFEAASVKLSQALENVECYQFTYLFGGFTVPPPSPVTVEVRKDALSQTEQKFETLQDFMALIQTKCMDRCPSDDGPAECQITYDDNTGFPTRIFIDESLAMADEEIVYTITDFGDCRNDDGLLADDDKCVNATALQAALGAARDAWSDPTCYDYKVQRVSNLPPNLQTTHDVQVRDGAAVDSGDTEDSINQRTIPDYYSMIQESCLAGCPLGKSHQCQVEFDPSTGVPTRIMIDPDSRVADEDFFVFSDFVECSDDDDNSAGSLRQTVWLVVFVSLFYMGW